MQYDAARLSTGAIVGAVADTGMRAWLEHEEPRGSSTGDRRQWMLAASGASLAVSLAANAADATTLAQVAALLTILSGGGPSLRRAWSALRLRTFDMHVLMTVAVAGAIAIGEWMEGASVVFLFALAQYLESRSMDRARHAIRALMDLSPPEATVVREGLELRVPADEVRIGDHVRVRPGEKLPLDGRVVSGESDVNQAPITGESLPVDKRHGDEVFAGSINGHGALEIVTTTLRRDTALARIIHLVETRPGRARARADVRRSIRAHLHAGRDGAGCAGRRRAAARWLGRRGPMVLSRARAAGDRVPVCAGDRDACGGRVGVGRRRQARSAHQGRRRTWNGSRPCAASRSTRQARSRAGHPAVADVVAVDGVPVEEVLRLAAAVNRHSEHPIGRVIAQQARARGLSAPTVTSFKAVPGQGAEGDVDGVTVLVGSQRLLAARGVDLDGRRPTPATRP